jgi:hypothetical protein
MILFKIYIVFHMIMFPIEEQWNAENPRPFPRKQFVTMNWEPEDFHYWAISKEYDLKKYRKEDNKYKAEARRYWHEHQANNNR